MSHAFILKLDVSDDGDATFAISGTTKVGESLSVTQSTADPDGTGELSYIWQSSPDDFFAIAEEIGTDSTYKLTSSEEDKKVRAVVSYTDSQGFEFHACGRLRPSDPDLCVRYELGPLHPQICR